jgi:hypothetical protein
MTTLFNVILPLGGIVFGAVGGWWFRVVEWCACDVLTATSLSMAQWRLGDAHDVMDSWRLGTLSGTMVASTVGLAWAM